MEKERMLQKLYKECIQELNRIGINFEDKEINIQVAQQLGVGHLTRNW